MPDTPTTAATTYSGNPRDPAFVPEAMAHHIFVVGTPMSVDIVAQLVTDDDLRAQVLGHLLRRQERQCTIDKVNRLLPATTAQTSLDEVAESIVDLLCPDLRISVKSL